MDREGFPTPVIFISFFLGITLGAAGVMALHKADRGGASDPMNRKAPAEVITLANPPKSLKKPDVPAVVPAEENVSVALKDNLDEGIPPEVYVAVMKRSIEDPSTQGKLVYLALLRKLRTEDAPGMIDLFRELSHRGHIVNDYDKLFWERWAEVDGEAASAAMFERDKRFRDTLLSRLAISTWAKNDPDAARAWLFAQEDIPLREGMVKGLLEGWARQDPAAAQRFLMNTDLAPDQLQHGFNEIARQVQMRDGVASVGEWFAGFAETDPDFGRVMNAATQIYARAPFEVALAWGEKLGDQSQGAIRTRTQLHDRLAEGRPDNLLIHLAQDPGATNLAGIERLTERAVAKWISTNPGAMANWLKANPGVPNYDLLTAPFAMRVASQDPEAARAWAGTIRNATLRDSVLERLSPVARGK